MSKPGATTDKPKSHNETDLSQVLTTNQDKSFDLFGVNDYLGITPDNENLSLMTDLTHSQIVNEIPDGWMRVRRLPLRLEGEYFGYQFLTALGLPAPRTQLVFDDNTGSIYIDSKKLTDFTDFGYNTLDRDTQTAVVNEEKLRLDPSIFVCFLSELVMQEKDHFSNLFVRHDDRMYQVTYDKEHASPTKITEAAVWAAQEKAQQGHYPSTLEQQFAVVHRLALICSSKPSVLEKIFYNARVKATDELNTPYRDELYMAWLANAQLIVNAYKSRYQEQYQAFLVRESIRHKMAEKIVSNVTLPSHIDRSTFHKELMDDLRSKCYFAEPGAIDEKILSNETELLRISQAEQRRFCFQNLQKSLALIIPDAIDFDVKHLYPTPDIKDLAAFYHKQKNKFLTENDTKLSMDNVQELIAQFQKRIKEKQLQAELMKILPSHYRYCTEPVETLLEPARLSLVLESFRHEARELQTKLEKSDEPYYLEDVHFYALHGFRKKLLTHAQAHCSKLKLSPQVESDALAQAQLLKDELKKTLKPFKENQVEQYAQRKSAGGIVTTHYEVWNQILPPLPEGLLLERIGDFYKHKLKFTYILQINAKVKQVYLDLNDVKTYLDTIFLHYAQPKDWAPKVYITNNNEISFEFANIEALNIVIHALVKDYHKIGGHNKMREKSFVYQQQQAFHELYLQKVKVEAPTRKTVKKA